MKSKVVLITGASSGIGADIARFVADAGHAVLSLRVAHQAAAGQRESPDGIARSESDPRYTNWSRPILRLV